MIQFEGFEQSPRSTAQPEHGSKVGIGRFIRQMASKVTLIGFWKLVTSSAKVVMVAMCLTTTVATRHTCGCSAHAGAVYVNGNNLNETDDHSRSNTTS